ncbi:MAG TPA: hypothetical protein VFT62_04695 [Mycobacteriales bacterium]|nr:hypothetical protein [Mycobacteriales bacterium]
MRDANGIRTGGLLADEAPWLSPGRHRWPRHEVCLMEWVSLLSGGPRTDHPRCTDPVLATIARAVNDYSGDLSRQRLAAFAPRLACAAGGDAEAPYAAARRCVLTALPYAKDPRRFVLVAATLGIDWAARGDAHRELGEGLTPDTEWALLDDAAAVTRAAALFRGARVTRREHARRGLPRAVELSIATIAEHAPDPDVVLHDLLGGCLDDYFGILRRPRLAAPQRSA